MCWILPNPLLRLFGLRIFKKAVQVMMSKASLGSTRSPRVAVKTSPIRGMPSNPKSRVAAHLVRFHSTAIANIALNKLSGRGCLCFKGCQSSHLVTSCQHGEMTLRILGNSCGTKTSKWRSSSSFPPELNKCKLYFSKILTASSGHRKSWSQVSGRRCWASHSWKRNHTRFCSL